MDQQATSAAPSAPAFPPAALPRCVLVAVAPLPLVALLGLDLADRPHYAFALLALPAAVLLAVRRLRAAEPFEPGGPAGTRAWLVIAWLVLAAAVFFWSRRGGAAALLLVTAALVWRAGGGRMLRAVFPALALVALCVPWPLNLDRSFQNWFLDVTASWAGHILDLARVAYVRDGTWFEVAGGRVNTAEIFNGFHSPFGLAATALFVSVWLGRGVLRTVTLMVTAVTFAVPLGAVATALDVNGPATGGVGWTAGILAALAFWASLALALSLDQLLGIPGALVVRPYTPPAPPGTEPGAPEPARPPVWLWSWLAALGFAALLAVQIVYLARGPGEAFAAGRPAPIGLTAPEVAGWVKLAGAADNPAVVLSARYRNGRQLADVAVFVPTAGHDDPILEFVRQGWVVRQREPLDAADDGTAMRLRLERPLDASGTLWLVNGSAQSRPAAVDAGTLARRLDRHLGRPAPAGSADRWLWVFVESYRPLDATWLRPPEQLFVEVRKQLGPRLAAGGEAP